MASAAFAWSHEILRPPSPSPSSLPPSSLPPSLPLRINVTKPNLTRRRLPFWRSTTRTTTLRVSPQSPQGGEEEQLSMSPIDTSRLLSDDFNYLWKLAAGSIGGASAIKYGSVVLPDITRPNLVQALLMISLPVLVAVLILIKESSKENQDEDLLYPKRIPVTANERIPSLVDGLEKIRLSVEGQ